MTKLLLVEDNAMNRDMLSRRLIRRGYEVVCAEDGESVLGILEQENPHLILMDISLPGMNGLQVTQSLRATEKWSKIPIIALTANAFQSDEVEARAAGCNEFETKPIDLERLLSKIEGLKEK